MTVADNNDYVSYSSIDFSVTLDAIRDKLIKTHGGFLRVRYAGGVKYLDYPDIICDQISDVVVTDCLQHDPSSRVAIEYTACGNPTRQYCSHECYISDRFWEGEQPVKATEIDLSKAPTVVLLNS